MLRLDPFLCTSALGLVVSLAGPAAADAVLDGSTGSTGTFSGNFEIPASVGRLAGGNLFHSFERFSVLRGESATFTGPRGIDNVINRVTGDEASRINGRLASKIPGADFFFLNPNGVVFGPKARLDVDGSFHVSTADELRFQDGVRFSATDPSASSFTVAAPEAFGFLDAESGGLTVDRGRLSVPAGEALSLIGGDIRVTAGNNGFATGGQDGTVRAEAGRITLAALGSPGRARVATGEVSTQAAADIRLSGQALVDASGDGAGLIRIHGGEIVVEDQSFVFADNSGGRDAAAGRGVTVRAGMLGVRDGSEISSSTRAGGNAGKVAVTADVLEVRDGGVISSGTLGEGDAGTVTVRAERLLVSEGIESFTGITGQANPGSTGAGGTVKVHATRLEIRDGGVIISGTFGSGDAGAVTVRAERLLHIDGAGDFPFSTGITTSADFSPTDDGQVVRSTGNAGAVNIRAGALEIRDGGEISSSTLGEGDAGTVTVRAERLLHIDGEGGERLTGISTSVSRVPLPNGQLVTGSGNAGAVTVRAGTLEIRDGGEISSFGRGESDAGTVTVRAGSAEIVGPEAQVVTFADAGEAGDIILKATDTLQISGAGVINRSTFGSGEGGTVEVRAGSVEIVGNTGSIGVDEISTASVSEDEDAGKAGGIILKVTDTLRMSDGAAISAETSRANAGNIEVQVGRLIDLEGSEITTSAAGGTGSGGNIFIDREFAVLNGSRIVAQAKEGAGGNIDIRAGHLFQTPDSVIDASSALGVSGTVTIDAPDVDVTSGLVALPTAFVDASALLRESCAAQQAEVGSSFVQAGQGGVAPGPEALLPGSYAELVGTAPVPTGSSPDRLVIVAPGGCS